MYKIAIVEDEPEYQSQLKRYIQAYEKEHEDCFDVHVFSDGLDILDNYTADYDIIFMDIQMPILNGYDAAREIRASGKERIDELPIIAMTADAFAEDVKHAGLSGMNGHLAKPISIERLREALSNCLSWKLHNQGSSPSCDEF